MKKNYSLLRLLTLLTGLAIFTQLAFLAANFFSNNLLDTLVATSITSSMFHARVIVLPILGFLFAQFMIYALFIATLWYIAQSMRELLKLSARQALYGGLFLWVISCIAILSANFYWIPLGFFSQLFFKHVFFHQPSQHLLIFIINISISIICIACIATFINLFNNFYKKKYCLRDLIASIIIVLIAIVSSTEIFQSNNKMRASNKQPNIIIIGFDALRPDFINLTSAPHMTRFLDSSTVFDHAYTPLSRTFPSWTTILTGNYPKHTHARGNDTDLDNVKLDDTLAKQLKQAGYQTFYATDDRRFNDINEQFGFDQIIGPPTGLNDFLLGSINDFPLTNLIIPTPWGKWLFPYSYANHGAPITYRTDNFLNLISIALNKRSDKPVFFAVHFNITAWPFYWFNDHHATDENQLERYKKSIIAGDNLFNQFMQLLQQQHLLDNTLVIFLSDHGISLGLKNDRIINKMNYAGNKKNIQKITINKYNSSPEFTVNYKKDFGIDTSYGYGTDILSLKQNHPVLAFKSLGFTLTTARVDHDLHTLLDVEPTIAELLHLTSTTKKDGESLISSLLNKPAPHTNKSFFVETSYTLPDIEREDISTEKVFKKSVHLYKLNTTTGLVFLDHHAERIMNMEKQHAILKNNWYLAQIPAAERFTFTLADKNNKTLMRKKIVPAFLVLVDLKTGHWTTEMHSSFANKAPVGALLRELKDFYGDELTVNANFR